MEVIRFENKDTTSNSYLVNLEGYSYIVDPGSKNMENLINYVKDNNINIKSIILTHGHFDHIVGLPSILKEWNVDIYISELDEEFLHNPSLNLISWYDMEQSEIDEALKNINIIKLNDGDILDIFKIILTPGHTRGGICLYSKKHKKIITGDTIFKNSYGRFDLPTGNSRDLRDSINKILKLPSDTEIFPGHGDITTVGEEYYIYYSGY